MHFVAFLMAFSCCISLSQCTGCGPLIPYEYSGTSGETFSIKTKNYDTFAAQYERWVHEVGPSDEGPLGYNMSERFIYTYSFTNNDTTGVIRLHFTEYDLHPNSLIYIYDGSTVSAPGSLWTRNTTAPVFSSTGPHIFMVFKTGQVDVNNTYLGFYAEVSFTTEHTWTDKPSHGLCKPLHMAKANSHYASFVELHYNMSVELPVYCSYTARITRQRELLITSTAADLEYVLLTDYPSATGGQIIEPYAAQRVPAPFSNETYEVFRYDISPASQGYHFLLRPRFTAAGQWVVVFTTQFDTLPPETMMWLDEIKPTFKRRDCPYKECAKNGSEPQCKDYQTPCWQNVDGELLDATCDSYTAEINATYTRCASTNHCYSREIDSCDGFADCSDETDETGCQPASETEDCTRVDDSTLTSIMATASYEIKHPTSKTDEVGYTRVDDTTHASTMTTTARYEIRHVMKSHGFELAIILSTLVITSLIVAVIAFCCFKGWCKLCKPAAPQTDEHTMLSDEEEDDDL